MKQNIIDLLGLYNIKELPYLRKVSRIMTIEIKVIYDLIFLPKVA